MRATRPSGHSRMFFSSSKFSCFHNQFVIAIFRLCASLGVMDTQLVDGELPRSRHRVGCPTKLRTPARLGWKKKRREKKFNIYMCSLKAGGLKKKVHIHVEGQTLRRSAQYFFSPPRDWRTDLQKASGIWWWWWRGRKKIML